MWSDPNKNNKEEALTKLLFRICAVVLILTLIGEIGIRALIMPAAIEADESLGWRYAPGSTIRHSSEGYAVHSINSLGLVDDEIAGVSGARPIVVLGDSFVESLQLPANRNFTSLAEGMGSCSSVLNAGRSGISPLHFPAMLAHVRGSVEPQAVVMAMSPGDLRDIKGSDLIIDTDDNNEIKSITYRPPKQNSLRIKLDPLLRRSALATFALNRLKAALAPAPRSENHPESDSLSSQDSDDNSDIEDILAFQMGETSQNVPSIVLFLPELEYMNSSRARATPRSTAFALLLEKAAARSQSHFVDTTDALVTLYKTTGQPGHGFANNSPTSGHLNEWGHKVVARELQSGLSAFGLCN